MFREMRRRRQQLTPDECSAILRGASSGVLAVLGDIGCSTGPALMGAVSGAISSSAAVQNAFPRLTADQLGLKSGMLFCILFPALILLGIFLLNRFRRRDAESAENTAHL